MKVSRNTDSSGSSSWHFQRCTQEQGAQSVCGTWVAYLASWEAYLSPHAQSRDVLCWVLLQGLWKCFWTQPWAGSVSESSANSCSWRWCRYVKKIKLKNKTETPFRKGSGRGLGEGWTEFKSSLLRCQHHSLSSFLVTEKFSPTYFMPRVHWFVPSLLGSLRGRKMNVFPRESSYLLGPWPPSLQASTLW